ncbi:amidohydrolase family protein [Clostridium argentinense CDC 2741]|uniref:Amidohydrolase family protein n=1 Tax=Clostridium argentinense CDC 2741 TaxID=1418104 RepID=A0A0C1R1S3_9CLOT|nr:amidohydrolase [Clostridium argentinense]ARC84276.1 hypothetical protein RSJ17_06875 [Clostridium argentinense]KIE44391.1 amidohydrolase family protein [Clostridium argentinense CDC 2741]NFF38235.1 amidohydrolase [Clostridium argentinense]NFP49180.1 amidohydrolase [Clostridium argentinense]NFP71540.1 amidohydrolase [Clostridium argentinense]
MISVDLLLYNGKIISLENDNAIYHWIAIKNNLIYDFGNDEGFKVYISNSSDVIDLKGKTILPGFYDSHVHLVQTGLNSLSLDLSKCTSLKQIFKLIENKAKETAKGQFIRATGLDEYKLDEKRLPNRYELDNCAPDHPVWINRVEYHTSIVNSLALHKLKTPLNAEGTETKNNIPTGVLTGSASALVRKQILAKISSEMRLEGVNKTLIDAIAKGVTSINAMEGGFTFHDKDAEFIYNNKDSFPIDIILFYQTVNINKVLDKNLKRIGGSIFLDGSFGSRTAALSEPYLGCDDAYGKLYFTQEEMNSFILKAYKNNIQVSTHAVGERAIEQIITAHEYAQSIYPNKNLRNRVEHFELPSLDHIKRANKLGLIASMQPTYEYLWGGYDKMYSKTIGKKKCEETNPFRKIIDNGLIICGGSDSDVTPINPILGIHSAVNHPISEHRVSVLEAIKMFTINSAYAVFEDNIKGSIKSNKYADFVILNENPLEIPKESLKDIEVLATIKEGHILYENNLR